MANGQSNPLLSIGALPEFSSLRPEHAVPAVDQRLAEGRAQVDAVLGALAAEPPRWETLLTPLEDAEDALAKTWSPVRHLHAVADGPAWRRAYNECLGRISDYETELAQSEALYDAYRRLAASGEFATLAPAQRKMTEDALRDFELAGVALAAPQKARFKELSIALTALASRFSEQVLDATEAWSLHLAPARAPAGAGRLRGLPPAALAGAARAAAERGLEGWLLTLDFPSYHAVMTYADDRGLRREIYTAYLTRASDQGPHGGQWDNGPLIEEIRAKRHELAELLGLASYAEYSLARKMARDRGEVLEFLRDLARRAKPAAERELGELEAYARGALGYERLEPWDVAYVGEKVRGERYHLSQEALREYFPLPRVLHGMFAIVGRLFGISVVPVAGDTWHPDVQLFGIDDRSGERRGHFYLDPYARGGKRGGAWMDACVMRRRTGQGIQAPAAFLCCNFSPPVGDEPARLTHDEVLTLFHEFGHGLHHLLTRVDHAAVSGINGVPWDAVELPSQFLEHWCWTREGLALVSEHAQTGAPLSTELIERLLAARNFLSGMHLVRQLEFALFDFRLHAEYDPAAPRPADEVLAQVREEVAVVLPPPFTRFAHSFSHIFAGGYGAGYYSYKWAELLASDAFSLFEERGLFDEASGAAFSRCILERGGSEDAMVLYERFRGRPARVDALLRHSGIESAGGRAA